jgi:5-methylcytosine-specific restriction enzyme A
MPNLPKRRCAYRGCRNTTRERFCDEHAALAMKLTDNRRGSARERGYDADWEKVAQRRRTLDCYLCQPCLRDHNRLSPSQTVDHIIPINVRPDLRLDIENTQVICPPCHRRKTLEDLRRYGYATGTPRTHTGASERRSYPDTIKAQGAGG